MPTRDTSLLNPLLLGVVDIGSAIGTDYFRRIRVGNGTPSYATGADSVYIGGTTEIVGVAYNRNNRQVIPVAHSVVLASGNAAALKIGTTWDAGVISSYMTVDTNDGYVTTDKKRRYESTSGDYNQTVSTILQTRQEEWFKFAVSADSGAAGMARIQNTLGTKVVLTDLYLEVTGPSSGASHAEIGITSGAASGVGNVMTSAGLTATGTRFYKLSGGGSGISGAPIPWNSNHYLNITASGGGAGGASSFAGSVYVKLKMVD